MYAPLSSPLPNLTVSPDGCHSCGMRGFLGALGQDDSEFDTVSTDDYGGLTDPNVISPAPVIATPDLTSLPLAPATSVNTSVEAMYPPTVGSEFVSNGDGMYTNIQTGQSVPYATAQQVTAATTGSATANLDTTPTQGTVTLTDPNTGVTSTIQTNNLTAAAQALNATGSLITAAGKLTAQGQALLNAGNLYAAPPSTNPLTSLTTWMSASTLFPGIPNAAVAVGLIAGVMVLANMGGKKR
jgi:hypothetical protein